MQITCGQERQQKAAVAAMQLKAWILSNTWRSILGLGFRVTYNLLSNCSYNLSISPITIVTLDIIGL